MHAVARMMSLTTAQRDILRLLLDQEAPISTALLAQQLRISARQVSYGLRSIKTWLVRRQVSLNNTPGVGVQLICTREQRCHLRDELRTRARFQLVLQPDQRQQLLALQLLAASTPSTLNQFQHDLEVARATVLKDLELLEAWFAPFQLSIARRQHRGFWLEGSELAQRHALAALLWGDASFEHPIALIDHTGISFSLAEDADLLPIAQHAYRLVGQIDLSQTLDLVTELEQQAGGRFTDDAFTHLALMLALADQRLRARKASVTLERESIAWAESQAQYPLILAMLGQLWPNLDLPERRAESALFTLQAAASGRDELALHASHEDSRFSSLIDNFLQRIATIHNLPELASDKLLRDGLKAQIVPACLRDHFGLWAPKHNNPETQGKRYAFERSLTQRLEREIETELGMRLPPDAHDNMMLLLRAAIVRARPDHAHRILVVCPSGMATTQLLVARLKARFPRLGTFEVLPMRELTPARVAEADLIISTVPLSLPDDLPIDVIQVHPMLKSENMAALTQWIAWNDPLLS